MNEKQYENLYSGIGLNVFISFVFGFFILISLNCRLDLYDKQLKEIHERIVVPEKSPEQVKIEQLEKEIELLKNDQK